MESPLAPPLDEHQATVTASSSADTPAADTQPIELKDPLVWIDCEMTGLDPDVDVIIEVFCLITDGALNVVDEAGFGVVVHQPASVMDRMGEWCQNTHGQSGLTAAVAASTTGPDAAAEQLLAYVQRYVPTARKAILAGNTVWQDGAFLRRGPWALLMDHLHYRVLDVSSIKEAARRWSPRAVRKAPRKKGLHQARDDILESIAEARFYQEKLFQPAEAAAEERAEQNRKKK